MKRKPIKAVHSDDLIQFLASIGILDEVRSGRLNCAICGDVVTLDNFQAVFPEAGEIRVVCSRLECVSAFLKSGKVPRE